MKKLVLFLLILFTYNFSEAKTHQLYSPDKQLIVSVNLENTISFNATYKNKQIIKNSTLELNIEGYNSFGKSANVRNTILSSVNQVLNPVIAQKTKVIHDEYNEIEIYFKGSYKLTFRAYNDGIAYRWSTSLKKDVIVNAESFNLNFTKGAVSYFPEEVSMVSHYERLYKQIKLDTLEKSRFCSLPVLMKMEEIKVLLTEADLDDYPAMFMQGTEGNGLSATYPKYVLDAKPKAGREDRSQDLNNADYIAKTSGTRDYPWRVMIITDQDKKLIESNLVFQLSSPLQIENSEWIKTGKVAWDWYNANNIYGVDFEAGINTETYKYYIDFASEYGLEYVILDEGWSKTTTNIKDCNPDIDVQELVEYGKEKNVGIILWVLWGPLDKNLNVLEQYENWGVKGIKVDFMQRADQYMVNYYEKVAKAAAKHHLLVDYHGAFKPAGLRRAYPNVLTYEGLKGNENNKWSKLITPEHNVTIPFIRMVAGPMDFTPGAMINATEKNHQIVFDRPMSLGTRCHQVAMYVVFESPLQMLCESPSTYYKEAETTRFISKIPTVWDETKVLEASIGDYILIARKKDEQWFIGGMTDWTAREFELNFSFLEEGSYTIEIMKDGLNTDRYAQDYIHESSEITNTSLKKIKMASGGGWTAIISKK